ncbi:cyclin-like protein [Blyttiomyces helicus]|uniref:Cyclin-like protein n=1 Tax=Blyttiomyces helicus TaxID=388810 RepID=A0A4V1IQB9_9FUNG|nr:cyclin-like protein [Blyttiomyces helicus]|eukprot:RKO86017.1 cyclin-like protein [Blyttiomyces helicus]
MKIEETPRPLRTVAQTVLACYRNLPESRITAADIDAATKMKIANIETKLLESIAFDTRILHPHRWVNKMAKRFGVEKDMAQLAWKIINESYRTTLCIQYPAHVIATSSLYLAARMRGDPIAQVFMQPATLHVCWTEAEEVEDITLNVAKMYVNQSELKLPDDYRKVCLALTTELRGRDVVPRPPPIRDVPMRDAFPHYPQQPYGHAHNRPHDSPNVHPDWSHNGPPPRGPGEYPPPHSDPRYGGGPPPSGHYPPPHMAPDFSARPRAPGAGTSLGESGAHGGMPHRQQGPGGQDEYRRHWG